MPSNGARFPIPNRLTRFGASSWRAFNPAFLACLALFSAASSAQACTQPLTLGPPGNTTASGNLFNNFLTNSTTAQMYEFQLGSSGGTNLSGDLNATYFSLYYSIADLEAWTKAGNCPVELLIFGTFPDSRYLSVTVNDAHYAMAQHISDADIDPVGSQGAGNSYSNPFVPTSPAAPYNGMQLYLVPISLGYVPSYGTLTGPIFYGCGITPFEQDNLLDATQRHLSNDWNTLPANNPLPQNAHVVDFPDHTNENTAGSILVRNYLPEQTCTTDPMTGLVSCTTNPALPTPFLIVRDAITGCPITRSSLIANNLVYRGGAINCDVTQMTVPTACQSFVSMSADPSTPTFIKAPNWLDQTSHVQHIAVGNLAPDLCYVDGGPNSMTNPSGVSNRVAWARSPEYVGQPGPDDAYIGGAISASDLGGMLPPHVSSCAAMSGDGCALRFRFRLPVMPNTPCAQVGGSYPCSLSGSEQLRYYSLTFEYQATGMATTESFVGNPDGISPTPSSIPAAAPSAPISLISLADTAFAMTPDPYGGNDVTLIVSLGANLPAWLQRTAGTGAAEGVSPATTVGNNYSVWTANGYTVLDLSQFASFSTSIPLLLTIRNTMPSSGFNCSGSAVPYSTLEYTNTPVTIGANTYYGGGLMGPYVPIVDYVDPNTLSATSPAGVLTLPLKASCGVLPAGLTTGLPGANAPAGVQQNFPEQYWPSSQITTTPPVLNCAAGTATSPGIYFVATQFPTPVDDAVNFGMASPTGCASVPVYPSVGCSQLVVQKTQTTEVQSGLTWQPGIPITIQGTGFGYLPNVTLPYAVAGTSFPYLAIQNDDASGLHPGNSWNTLTTPGCQLYITNWSNNTITVVPNLPPPAQNGYQFNAGTMFYLSLLGDFTPFDTVAPGPGSGSGCPIAVGAPPAAGDNLTFTVTNPQTSVSEMLVKVPISAAGPLK